MHIINLALHAGKKLQKKQTSFIHYCYETEEPSVHDTIPTLENALFALTLFRTRLSEHVLEGKEIIQKLLAFEVDGNFPRYLHEYPKTFDRFLGLRLLPVFFWILFEFSRVIGELNSKLADVIDRIISTAKKQTLPEWGSFRLQALEGKVGQMPMTLLDWGEALISLQMAEKKGALIEPFLQKAFTLWHPKISLYIGPGRCFFQNKDQPEVALFELFMAEWQKQFPQRINQLTQPLILYGSLVQPLSFEPSFEKLSEPYLDFDSQEEFPLLLAWNKHTFVLEKHHLQVTKGEEGWSLSFDTPFFSLEDKGLEVNFFLSYDPEHKIFINGKKATTFQLGDSLEIHCQEGIIKLVFSAENGTFFGHIQRGNRPSQRGCQGEDRFTAYDWRLSLRTIERDQTALIRVQLLLEQKPGSQWQFPWHASHYPHTALSQ